MHQNVLFLLYHRKLPTLTFFGLLKYDFVYFLSIYSLMSWNVAKQLRSCNLFYYNNYKQSFPRQSFFKLSTLIRQKNSEGFPMEENLKEQLYCWLLKSDSGDSFHEFKIKISSQKTPYCITITMHIFNPFM